jgi:hypothetical protein
MQTDELDGSSALASGFSNFLALCKEQIVSLAYAKTSPASGEKEHVTDCSSNQGLENMLGWFCQAEAKERKSCTTNSNNDKATNLNILMVDNGFELITEDSLVHCNVVASKALAEPGLPYDDTATVSVSRSSKKICTSGSDQDFKTAPTSLPIVGHMSVKGENDWRKCGMQRYCGMQKHPLDLPITISDTAMPKPPHNDINLSCYWSETPMLNYLHSKDHHHHHPHHPSPSRLAAPLHSPPSMKTQFSIVKHECLNAGGEDALYARVSKRRSDLVRQEAEHKLYVIANPHAQASYVVVSRADDSATGWRRVPVHAAASARAGMPG